MEEAQSTSKSVGNAALTAQGIGKATGIGAPTGLSAANIGALNAGGAGLSAAGAPLTGAGIAGATNAITGGTTALGASLAPAAAEAAGLGATALGPTAATLAPAAASTALTAAPVVAAAPSIGATIAAAIPAFLAMFSDERLKEDIKLVGKTYDGQHVYSYRMKGDPTTHMGLLAQEVERHHPEAVGLAGGYKTVNYKQATHEAAKRGHFADGGLAGRHGYAVDGYVGYSRPFESAEDPEEKRRLQNLAAANEINSADTSSQQPPIGGVAPPTDGESMPFLGAGTGLSQPITAKNLPAATPTDQNSIASPEKKKYETQASYTPWDPNYPPPADEPAMDKAQLKTAMTDRRFNPFPIPGLKPPAVPVGPSRLDTMRSVVSSGAPEGMGGTLGFLGAAGDVGRKAIDLAKNAATNPDLLIPILSGIGAYGSTGTTDVGSKLAAAIGAGAKSYQGMRQFEVDKALKEAETSATNVATGAAARDLPYTEDSQGRKWVFTENNEKIPFYKYTEMPAGQRPKLLGSAQAAEMVRRVNSVPDYVGNMSYLTPYSQKQPTDAQGQPNAAPTPADQTPPVDYYAKIPYTGKELTPENMAAFDAQAETYQRNPRLQEMDAASASKTEQDVIKNAASASAEGRLLSELYQELRKMPQGGFGSQGPLIDLRTKIATVVNQIQRVFAPEAKLLFNPDDAASKIGSDKITGLLQVAKARGAGQDTLGALQMMGGLVAGTGMPPEASNTILAQSLTTRGMAADANRFLADSKKYVASQHPDYADAYNANTVMNEFRKTYTDAYYSKVNRAMLGVLSMASPLDKNKTIYQDYLDGNLSGKQVDTLVNNPNFINLDIPNFSNYLTGQ
jgi:hypothetical protein